MRGMTSRIIFGLATLGLASAKVVFKEDFKSELSQWKIEACPGAVQISTDAARTGRTSAKFTVRDEDTNATCAASPTENPRGQLVAKPGLFNDGDEYFIGFSVLFPHGFPNITDWFMFFELYGPPYNGTPSMALFISKENRITFGRDISYGKDTIWTGPHVTPGKWHDIALHVKFSTDPAVGFVEIWENRQRQQLVGGNYTIFYRTLNPQVNYDGTPNHLVLNQYRNKDTKYGSVTLYHDSVRVGTKLKDVLLPSRSGC